MKTIRFKSLSSGSCGNCYFVGIFEEDGRCEAAVLVDAGVSPRRLKKELQRDNLTFEDFQAILVTHDHMDHIRSLGSYCKHVGKPVWTTKKLHNALARHTMTGEFLGGCRHVLEEGWNDVVPGRIRVQAFEVPHDATQTVGYAILLDEFKFVIMTDIGRMTEQGMAFAKQADTVVVESNYDPWMLEHGPYPKELQDRIRDGHGHLSNPECAAAIGEFNHDGLRSIFLCHLSEHNNTPALALEAARAALPDKSVRILPLPRETASPFFVL